jgi:hypothetical protein
LYIAHYLQWTNGRIYLDGRLHIETAPSLIGEIPLKVYEQAGVSYPKFFKMDLLSKVAFMSAELLSPFPPALNKEKTATVLSTASGCIEVDKKFEESRQTLASPALFVYTLPNIMLGEICIRHGFKGEQLCTVEEQPNMDFLQVYVSDLFQNRGTAACLCGHVNATGTGIEAVMIWVNPEASGVALPFTSEHLKKIFTPL